MDPGHRTNDSPTTNPGEDEGATKDGTSGLKKLDEPYFAYGDHADVYKGILDGKPVAIKQLRGVNSAKTDVRDNLRVGLRRQFSKSWRHFNHPNVCRVYMVVEDYGFLPALVLDYYPRGSLIKHIEKNNPPFPQRLKWASDIAEGLGYLHSKHVHHGDLRGANVFLDKNDNAVVADYGIVHYFNNSDFTSAKSTGTVRWTGPETISLPPNPSPKYDKLDVFALGMTILEVLSGQPPYADKPDTGAIFAIAKSEPPKLPESMSDNPELKKLFDDCTRKIPDDRPPASDIAERLRAVSTAFYPPNPNLSHPSASSA